MQMKCTVDDLAAYLPNLISYNCQGIQPGLPIVIISAMMVLEIRNQSFKRGMQIIHR